jgi:hypothetical protein
MEFCDPMTAFASNRWMARQDELNDFSTRLNVRRPVRDAGIACFSKGIGE